METPEEDVLITTSATERDCLVEQSLAQPHRPGWRINQQPAQLSIPLRMADNRDTTGETSFPFSDPEPVGVGSRVNELPQEAGNIRLESRVEATLPRIDNPMQGDKGAEVARSKLAPQGECHGRIAGWGFERIHGPAALGCKRTITATTRRQLPIGQGIELLKKRAGSDNV
jgi:hypothetical protein